jgi:putative transposase
MALWLRRHEGIEIFEGLIHDSDAGSQYVSLKFSEELMLEGVLAFMGSVGDAYDTALAETTIGLFKTEVIRPGNPFHPGPLKTIGDIEFAGLGLG